MATARYDGMADFYDRVVGDRTDDNAGTVALLDLIGDVRGCRLLDLACGQGRIARELARRGASVVGVDISAALLNRAQAIEDGDGARTESMSKVEPTSVTGSAV